MLSVLIPIYEVKVEKLVKKIHKQCLSAKIDFEIICLDDFSSEKIRLANRSIDLMLGVNYVELSENKGRSKIRNRLAKLARYDYILFLDCDTKINNRLFIKNYISHLKENRVLCGGRIYASKKPKSEKKILHWLYGTKRESKLAKHRNKKPLDFFHSNNIVMPRHTAYENPFEESILGYGYEDLALANQMAQRGIEILHIDNPTVHKGLENNDIFLKRGIEATDNLWALYKAGKVPYTRLIRAYKFLDAYGLKGRFMSFYQKRKAKQLDNLKSSRPTLWFFDFYRLSRLIELSQE